MSFYNVALLPRPTNKLWVPQWEVDEELTQNKEEDEYLTRLTAIAGTKAPMPIGVREHGDRNAQNAGGTDSGSELEEEFEDDEMDAPSPAASASFDDDEYSD